MQVTIRRVEIRLAAAALLLATVAASDPLDTFELAERQTIPTTGGNLIEICPNQNYEGLNETITCMNITDPTVPHGYGGRTCSKSAHATIHT